MPSATAAYAVLVGVPILLIAVVPAWRRAANAWARAHPILQAGIGAVVFGLGFATWSGWLTGVVVAAAWFAVWVLLGRAHSQERDEVNSGAKRAAQDRPRPKPGA
jgi:hypothetical protein